MRLPMSKLPPPSLWQPTSATVACYLCHTVANSKRSWTAALLKKLGAKCWVIWVIGCFFFFSPTSTDMHVVQHNRRWGSGCLPSFFFRFQPYPPSLIHPVSPLVAVYATCVSSIPPQIFSHTRFVLFPFGPNRREMRRYPDRKKR